MSKWSDLNALFQDEHVKTGISVTEFCEKHGLTYNTARKHIRARVAVERKRQSDPKPTKPKQTQKKQKRKVASGKDAPNYRHGGYTKYYKDEINNLVEATTLDHELDLCRARIHMVMQAVDGINKTLDDPDLDDPDLKVRMYESLFKAEQALDKNVGRVESIVRTLSALETDSLTRGKLVVETARISQQTKALVNATKRGKHQAEIAEHEATKARKEAGGTSKLDNFIDSRTDGLDQVVSE